MAQLAARLEERGLVEVFVDERPGGEPAPGGFGATVQAPGRMVRDGRALAATVFAVLAIIRAFDPDPLTI